MDTIYIFVQLHVLQLKLEILWGFCLRLSHSVFIFSSERTESKDKEERLMLYNIVFFLRIPG